MGGFGDIARHFGLKAVYVIVAWGVMRVLRAGHRHLLQQRSRASNTSSAAQGQDEARSSESPSTGARPIPKVAPRRYRVYHNPTVDFKPSNPRWIQEAASLDPADLATDLSWQCPLLIQFQAKVAGLSRPWQQQLQQQPQQSPQLQQRTPQSPSPASPQQQHKQQLQQSGRQQGAAAGGGSGGAIAAAAVWEPPDPAVSFGRAAREQLFALDPDVTYLNHGSYGAAFRLALEVQSWYRAQMEAQPVRFMEAVALKGLVAAVADAARFVGACPADVVPLINATTAVNAVLQSLLLRRGDWILMLNTTYPAVRSSLARVAAEAGASILEVQLGLEELRRPASVVGAVQAALGAVGGRRRVRLAVLDHVVSFPPVVLPIPELAVMCKKVGALVLVDGAHAVGNVPRLQVSSLGADFYTTNLHKWGCSPKGAALLWAAPEQQPALRPLVTSHGYRLGFRGEFLWQGTADPSAWLAVPAALALLRALGPERLAARNATLVADAAAALRRRWQTPPAAAPSAPPPPQGGGGSGGGDGAAGTSGTAPGPTGRDEATTEPAAAGPGRGGGGGSEGEGSGEVRREEGELLQLGGGGEWPEGGGAAGMMAVQLPVLRQYECTAEDAVRLQQWLRHDKGIEVPVVAALGSLWVRLSAQIYNEAADYERLGEAVGGLRRG